MKQCLADDGLLRSGSLNKLLRRCFLILTIALWSCKSSPDTPSQSPLKEEEIAFVHQGYFPRLAPKDWPLTREEVLFLRSPRQVLTNPQLPTNAGFHTPQEIVDFVHRVLNTDLSPIGRDTKNLTPNVLQGHAYELLGLYGSAEDARFHLEEVKKIEGHAKGDANMKSLRMIQGLGYYLMRDHFMPQEDRAIIQEIEAYLEQCSDFDQPFCWPSNHQHLFPNKKKVINILNDGAFQALAYGCGEHVKSIAKEYSEYPQEGILHIIGENALNDIKHLESDAAQIRKLLPPVQTK